MELKTVEIEGKTYAEIQDNKPVYVDDGKEVAFDAPGTVATISRLNGEAQGHREAKEAAEKKLKVFGDLDPEKAIKAVETVESLDAKRLIDAGEKDKAIEQAVAAVEEKYAGKIKSLDESLQSMTGERDEMVNTLNGEMIGGAFSRSKWISENLTIPADMVEARFGKQFKIEDKKVVAYDMNGNEIFSKERPGEKAGFDEAMSILVDGYAQKDHILKGNGNSGAGSTNTNGGDSNGSKVLTRAQYDAMNPGQRSVKMSEGYSVTE